MRHHIILRYYLDSGCRWPLPANMNKIQDSLKLFKSLTNHKNFNH